MKRALRTALFWTVLPTVMGCPANFGEPSFAGAGEVEQVPLPSTWGVYMDPDVFEIEEREGAFDALDTWASATGNQVKWSLHFDHAPVWLGPSCTQNIVVRKAYSQSLTVQRIDESASMPDGTTVLAQAGIRCHERVIVLIQDRLLGQSWKTTREVYRVVLVHELGHHLGLRHVESGKGMMASTLREATDGLTTADLKEFCRTPGCRADLLHPKEARSWLEGE